MNLKSSARKHSSVIELLRELDRFISDSSFGVDYQLEGYATTVAKVLERAQRRRTAKPRKPRPDQLMLHLNQALEAMKASDPILARQIDYMEKAFDMVSHRN